MTTVELILVLLTAAVVLAIAADRVRLPYPIVLVLGGVALASAPGVPRLEIPPGDVLVIFLPPLLYAAASLTSWRDFRTNVRDIGMLAIGLVIATTVGVAVVAHALVPDLPWSIAFVLGAIVSPPDAVAATSVMQRLRVPPRLVTILEGESLVNDATGLVAYQIALSAVAGGAFSATGALRQFAVVGIGGLAFGFVIGWLVAKAHRRLDDFHIETAISLLTPYAAYIPAEHLGLSGVLAAVSAGGYLGWRNPHLFKAETRLRTRSVWSAVLFLLNSLVFILIGLELAGTHRLFQTMSAAGLVAWCAAITGTTIVIRLVWVPVAVRGTGKEKAVVAWTAMRGIVSLALALALPDDLPFRDLLVLIVFVVIAVTLLGQGLTLPLVIRWLGIASDGHGDRQERAALITGTERALARLDELAAKEQVPAWAVERLRGVYERRRDRLQAAVDDAPLDAVEAERTRFREVREQLIDAERTTYVDLRNRGEISEEILLRLQNDLDLETLQPLR